MILPIYTYGQPVLRKEAADVAPGYPGLDALIADMFETLTASDGVGLAAPQVGLSLRLVVIDLNDLADEDARYKDFRRVYINPEIVEADESQTTVMEEGCLSLPGIHEPVRRPKRIHVTYLDEHFDAHDEWVDGFLARVMQHEFDHLRGRMFIDRLTPLRRQMVQGKLKSLLKGNVRCGYKVKVASK